MFVAFVQTRDTVPSVLFPSNSLVPTPVPMFSAENTVLIPKDQEVSYSFKGPGSIVLIQRTRKHCNYSKDQTKIIMFCFHARTERHYMYLQSGPSWFSTWLYLLAPPTFSPAPRTKLEEDYNQEKPQLTKTPPPPPQKGLKTSISKGQYKRCAYIFGVSPLFPPVYFSGYGLVCGAMLGVSERISHLRLTIVLLL